MSSSAAPTTVVRELVVEVLGTPAPQGSKTYKGLRACKPVLVESSAAVGPWREVVAWSAYSAMTRELGLHGRPGTGRDRLMPGPPCVRSKGGEDLPEILSMAAVSRRTARFESNDVAFKGRLT